MRREDSKSRQVANQLIKDIRNGVTTRDKKLRLRVCLESLKFLLEAADDLPPGVIDLLDPAMTLSAFKKVSQKLVVSDENLSQ